jgi:hypothetical protein
MTKQEIYEAVQRLGYRFTTKDPFNVIGVVIYGKNPRFRNDNGRFSPIGGATAAPTRRRTMSPASRARIATAQRVAKQKRESGVTNGARKRRHHVA